MSQIRGSGLIPPKKELINLDFSYQKQFGGIKELPESDFVVAEPLGIKEQEQSDLCTAFGTASVSEDQEGVELAPEYSFAKIKELMGDWQGFGGDPRQACLAATKYGFLEKDKCPYQLANHERDFIANWKNWPPELDSQAGEHRKKSFFVVDGQKDLFDSMRAVMWANRSEKRSIFTGCYWQNSWTNITGGIIPKDSMNLSINPHAFKIFGQKRINGEIHLVAQLSNGTEIGDNGKFYFPRNIINRFLFAYTFKDLDPEEAKRNQWSLVQLLKYKLLKLFS